MMDQVQLFKAAAQTGVAHDQPIKFEHSLKMLKTVLLTSFSCLTFLRGLLPDDCFDDVTYGDSLDWPSTSKDGTSQASSEPRASSSSSKSPGQKMKRLKRDSSYEANQLLDWIELGIFDALDKGYLKAISLAIYLDDSCPNVIFELYTFSFAYREGIPTGFNIKDMAGNEVTTSEAKRNIQQVMRRLIFITQNMPPLPDRRFLTIRMQYMDHTPESYTPKLFRKIVPSDSRFEYQEETDDKVLDRQVVGSVSTGIHAISVKVVGFVDPSESQQRRKRTRISNPDDEIEVPPLKNLQVPQESSNSINALPSKSTAEKPMNAPQPVVQNPSISRGKTGTEKGVNVPTTPAKSQTYANGELGERERRELEILKKQMIPSPPSASNLISTQLIDGDMDVDAPMPPAKQVQKLKLKEVKLKEMEQKKMQKDPKVPAPKDDVVTCECGFAEDDGDMTNCEACGNWVHIDCYGYKSVSDERLPEFFVCYSCLLTTEKGLLDQMRELTLFRRALTKLRESGYPKSVRQFAKAIGCDLSLAMMLTKRLEKEEFIVDTSKAKHRKKSSGCYGVLTNEENGKKMNQYFEPTLKLSNFFEISTPAQSEGTQWDSHLPPPPLPPTQPATKSTAGEFFTGKGKQKEVPKPIETNKIGQSKHFSKTYKKHKKHTGSKIPDSQLPEEPGEDATSADEMDIDPPPKPSTNKSTGPVKTSALPHPPPATTLLKPQLGNDRPQLSRDSPWRNGSMIPIDLDVSSNWAM